MQRQFCSANLFRSNLIRINHGSIHAFQYAHRTSCNTSMSTFSHTTITYKLGSRYLHQQHPVSVDVSNSTGSNSDFGHSTGQSLPARNVLDTSADVPGTLGMSVDYYLSIRSSQRNTLRFLRPRTFLSVAHSAANAKLFGVVDSVCDDAIYVHRVLHEQGKAGSAAFARLFHDLLKLSQTHDAPRNDRVVRLYETLLVHFPEERLPQDSVLRVGDAALALPLRCVGLQVLYHVATSILSQFHDVETSSQCGGDVTGRDVASQKGRNIWLLFQLLQRIMSLGEKQLALDLFKAMLDRGCISSTSMHETDQNLVNFYIIVLSALVRSCLALDWHIRASNLLRRGNPNDEDTERFIHLIEYVAIELLSLERRSTTVECAKLLSFALKKCPESDWSETMVKFYDSACQLNLAHSAMSVFCLSSQSPLTVYVPNGQSLSWLMKHLVHNPRSQHVARILAKTVADSPEALSPHIRASFIRLCARSSFVSEAKSLWQRYAVDVDKDMVTGNAGTMLRLVSLFTNIEQKTKASETETVGAGTSLAELDTEQRRDGLLEVSDSAFNGDTPPESRVECFSEFAESKEGENENASFAWHVVDSFRKVKEPLVSASHMDLNALARAYGMLGDINRCLDTLTIVFKRREIPDIHDINVVIAMMARRHPIRAAGAVEMMLANGVKPDAVTFGTVIHEALSDGNTELAGRMIKLAQSIGIEELTPQSVVSIVEATVDAVLVENGDRGEGCQVRLENGATVKGYLEQVYELIASGAHRNYLQSAKLGNKCIRAALRVDEPELAFKFWNLTFKSDFNWDSNQRKHLRWLITQKIREQCRKGKMDVNEARRMVKDLGGIKNA